MDTKALRQKILDLAIRGKLVPQDPNDEPAEVLLERIREQKQQMLKEGQELDEEQQTALDDAIAQITDEDIYNYILEMNPDVKGIFATNGDTTMQALTACEGKEIGRAHV